MFEFFEEDECVRLGGITTDRAIALGREIIDDLRSRYDVESGVGGMVGALAICCAEAELQDGKTADEALAVLHESIDQCFRRLRSRS